MGKLQEQSHYQALEKRLLDLKARLPAHSIPPSMMIELDELEEQLAELVNRADKEEGQR